MEMFSTCGRSSMSVMTEHNAGHMSSTICMIAHQELMVSADSQCHCSTRHLGADGVAPHMLRGRKQKGVTIYQSVYNYLIPSPGRDFIFDTMLPTPCCLLNTWQNFFSGVKLHSATIFLSTAYIKIGTFSNSVSRRTSNTYLAALLPCDQSIAEQDSSDFLRAATQRFTQLGVISLEHTQSQVMKRLG